MANKVGTLIKEARTKAGFTQEQLARKITGVTASDLSKAERGEKELTQTALKQIAKICGVTQTSLIEASKSTTNKKTTTTTAKKPATTTAKKTTSSSLTLTATEKKLVELYRAADKDTKEEVMAILKGEEVEGGDLLGTLISGAMQVLGNKK